MNNWPKPPPAWNTRWGGASGGRWRILRSRRKYFIHRRLPGTTTGRVGTDFYPEGVLLWLEIDVTIRQQTQGKYSLDDFCRKFAMGGKRRADVEALCAWKKSSAH